MRFIKRLFKNLWKYLFLPIGVISIFSATDYSRKEIKAMTHKEVSDLISELQDDMLYNELMSYGLPNQ